MGPSKEDWSGKLEFGFIDNKFDKDSEDYFILFEDQCTLFHNCAGKVHGLQALVRDKVLEPLSYHPINIVTQFSSLVCFELK